MSGFHSGPVLARVKPHDLTIQDCKDGWFSVTLWCEAGCPGRDLDLNALPARWSDRRLLDLMREGAFACNRCQAFAATVTVSSTEMADRVLFWSLGDDAMPKYPGGRREKPIGRQGTQHCSRIRLLSTTKAESGNPP